MNNTCLIQSRSEIVLFIQDNINAVPKKTQIEIMTMLMNSGIDDKYIQEKAKGTSFDITKCPIELIERIYNCLQSALLPASSKIN